MKKKEIEKMKIQMGAPVPPVRFTIGDEPFEFGLLPLGTMLIIERIESELNINQKMMDISPLVEWLSVTKRQTADIRKIVCLLLSKGRIDMEGLKRTSDFLRENCSIEDLCSLFIIGSMAQDRWLRDMTAEKSAVLEGFSEHDLWSKPLVELLKDK